MALLPRGLDISHWFRFPPSNAAEAMENDLDDGAIASLRRAGFTFVRLPIGPEEVMEGERIVPAKRDAIVSVVARLEQAGLAVLVEPNPELMGNWDLQRNARARAKLLGFWRDLAPALRHLSPDLTFPELVNEPLYRDPAPWDLFQRRLLSEVRRSLPGNTIVLTGTDWSSIDGLLKVRVVPDRNVIYSFHTYDPQILTILAAWDTGINRAQLARVIPFPVRDEAACRQQVATITEGHTLEVAQHWCSLHQDAVSIATNISRAVKWAHVHHVSVAMTEFGAVSRLNPQARLNYLVAVRTAAEKLHLPWGLWALDDQNGFDQQPGQYRTIEQLSPLVMRALGLPP